MATSIGAAVPPASAEDSRPNEPRVAAASDDPRFRTDEYGQWVFGGEAAPDQVFIANQVTELISKDESTFAGAAYYADHSSLEVCVKGGETVGLEELQTLVGDIDPDVVNNAVSVSVDMVNDSSRSFGNIYALSRELSALTTSTDLGAQPAGSSIDVITIGGEGSEYSPQICCPESARSRGASRPARPRQSECSSSSSP